MAVGTNHWKLGLFVIVGIALSLTVLVVLGARRWNEKTVTYSSFFDESVQGLEVGSPVKYRGVTIGRVAAIEVAPDQRHVRVDNELSVEELDHLGLRSALKSDKGLSLQPKLRVQLSQTGITGVKFMLLDFFENAPLEPKLPFKVPKNVIPSTPSTMKNLEDTMVRTANQFPDIATALLGTATKLNNLMDSVEEQRLPTRAGGTLTEANDAMHELKSQLQALKAGELSAHAEEDLKMLNQTLASANQLITRMDGDDGLVRSFQRAANSMDGVARGAQTVGPELDLTLREVRGAARSLKRFLDALERDPDMLLKGRRTAAK
jgi:ABC-type transporter Mla subunit MlaD